jgi:hypothetical protein
MTATCLMSLGLLPCHAGAATLRADPETLQSVLKRANAGDVIRLAGGPYPVTGFISLTFPPPGVTLKPADPSRPPVFAGIVINGSQGIRLSGLEISYSGKGFAYTVANSAHIYADGMNVHGAAGDRLVDGAMLRAASDIAITNSEFHDLGNGISHIEDDGVRLVGNVLHGIRADGIHGGGTSNLEISANLFYDFKAGPGEHPDAIQFWGTRDHPKAGPITIEDNVVVRPPGSVAQSQGIFGAGAHDVRISRNLLVGTMYNGIALGGVERATIDHNYVQGMSDMSSGIVVRYSSDAQIKSNFANSVNVSKDSLRVTEEGNRTMRQSDGIDDKAYRQWRLERAP